LITLLLSIPSTHRNETWAKLNARHLGTRICWLLINSYFCSFITARWRHWCKGKTVNSCCTFLSKPHRQTVVKGAHGYLKPYKLQICIVSCTQATCKLIPYAAYNWSGILSLQPLPNRFSLACTIL